MGTPTPGALSISEGLVAGSRPASASGLRWGPSSRLSHCHVTRITWGGLDHAGPHPSSDSWHLEGTLKTCLSDEFPGDADAARCGTR